MHELSLARRIVAIAENEMAGNDAKLVKSIDLQIGTCSGVERDAFLFAWPIAVKDSILEEAERNIETIEGRATCLDCDEDFAIEKVYDGCPRCGSYHKDIYQGKEFRVNSITVI